jgi:nitronate monooxygenase
MLHSCVAVAEAFGGDVVGEATRLDGSRTPVLRFATAVADATAAVAIGALPLWAGESVGGVARVQSAAGIVRELAEGAEVLLRRFR